MLSLFVGLNAYPIWRFYTFVENAFPVNSSSSCVPSSSSFPGSYSDDDDGKVPDHSTLFGLWIGLGWGVFTFFTMLMPLVVSSRLRFLQSLCRWVSRFIYQILTTIMWLFVATIVWEFVDLAIPEAHGDPDHGNGAFISLVTFGSFAVFVTLAHTIHGLTLYSKHITIVSPKVKQPFTIAHISDVHIGSRTKLWLRRVVNKINSEPSDVVIISGDLFDYPGVQNHELDPLFDIKSPVYAVSGNHEIMTGEKTYHRLFSYISKKVTIIDGKSIPAPGESGVMLLGVRDNSNKESYLNTARQLAKKLDDDPEHGDSYRVLVNHRPWGFRHMATEQLADLLLSGHTHAGGQLLIGIPLAKVIFPMYHGYYTIGERHMYCSPGTGTWGPYVREWGFNLVAFIHIIPETETNRHEPDETEPLCPHNSE